jgi:hypothetical protein
MAPVTSLNHKQDQHQSRYTRIGRLQLLNRVAAHPWALSFTSFTLTALLIRWDDLNLL